MNFMIKKGTTHMNDKLESILDTCVNTIITTKYDIETSISKKSSETAAKMGFKGEFAVTPAQIITAGAVLCGFCIVASIARKKKKKK